MKRPIMMTAILRSRNTRQTREKEFLTMSTKTEAEAKPTIKAHTIEIPSNKILSLKINLFLLSIYFNCLI
jgi:hypothetical protein